MSFESPSWAGGGPRVLLFHGNRLEREALASRLERERMVVLGDHGEVDRFIDHLVIDPPDVAVVVAQAGFALAEALRRIKEASPYARTLVLASGDADTTRACYLEGASALMDLDSATPESVISAVRALSVNLRVFPVASLSSLASAPSPVDDAASPVHLPHLSPREHEVLSLIATGADNLKIAAHLGIRERTVKAHVSSLIRKLHKSNRTELAMLALQARLARAPHH